jgi:1-acyl-sn-glycerol-3-phosphate acyltransferase
MIFLRSLAYAIWFYLSILVIGLVCLPASMFSRGAAMSAIRFWSGAQRVALRVLCGIKTEFRGMEHMPAGKCIIAMKHQSTYDTIAPFLFIRDPVFILKKELLRAPVFGIYASRVGIPIDRDGRVRTMKAMLAAAKKAAESDRQIVIFPEGTRQPVDAAAEFKPGVVAMYNELDVPCVPIALNTGLCWEGAGFVRRPGHVVFEVLKPIRPGLERRAFMQKLKDALDPATARLVAEGRAAQGKRAAPVPAAAAPPVEPGA